MKLGIGVAFGFALGLAVSVGAARTSPAVANIVVGQTQPRQLYSSSAIGRGALRLKKGDMLVLANSEGRAIIELTDFGDQTATYRWRARSQFGLVGRGEGSLTERFVGTPSRDANKILDMQRSDVLMGAGPFDVQWSYADSGSGWVYVDQRRVQAHIVPASQFDTFALAN